MQPIRNAAQKEIMLNETRNTLKKEERLSSKTDLAKLFNTGRYGHSTGIRFCYREGNALSYNRIVVSVPKKNFRRAVKRNLLKRRIREAYRQQKNLLPVVPGKGGTDILFVYCIKDVLEYAEISGSVSEILTTIAGRINRA